MLLEGILDSLVSPPAAPISFAAIGAPRIADTFGAMNAILDSTYLGDNVLATERRKSLILTQISSLCFREVPSQCRKHWQQYPAPPWSSPSPGLCSPSPTPPSLWPFRRGWVNTKIVGSIPDTWVRYSNRFSLFFTFSSWFPSSLAVFRYSKGWMKKCVRAP